MAKIVIVGGGVAGLAAGIHAQLSGHSATVYERHFKAGGNLTGWDRRGYHIDNCIHWLTGTNKVTDLYKMWCELGALGEVELHRQESLFTFDMDGERLSLGRNADELCRDMLKLSPEDKGEIKSFIKAVKRVQALCGISYKENDKPATVLQKLSAVPSLMKYYSMTTGDLAKRFKSPVISGLIESLMTDSFSALALIMVFATFSSGNGDIPYGSSCGMADRMAERFTSLGGVLELREGVSKINVDAGAARSVTLDSGIDVEADYVIVTADPAVAFGTLLDKELMPASLRAQYASENMRRFSAYHCAYACDSAELPFSGDIVFEIPEKHRELLGAKYVVVREFSHEKTFAPEGKNVIQSMIYCFEEDAKRFIELRRDTEAYREKKRLISEAIAEIICERMPALAGKLSCLDVWTPATYRRFVGSEVGSFMSFALPAKTVPKKISPVIKGLSNVYLATQWQNAPGGLPIAAQAGIDAISVLKLAEKKKMAIAAAKSLRLRRRRAKV